MKTFTTVHEAVETANEFGITATQISEAIGISRQNFNNKLKSNGSNFTPVHLENVNNYLQDTFTALHKNLSQLLEVKTFTEVKEPIVEKFVLDTYKLQKEYEAAQRNGSLDNLSELEELPY